MKRCLFVDRSSVIRKVAKRILSDEMAVAEAETGHDAVVMCQADMPDIVVIDVGLHDLTAVDVISRIRAIQADKVPYMLVMLTEKDVGAIMRAKRAGAKGYILKPFDRAHLYARLSGADSTPAVQAAASAA